jgi:DNA gyrase/topoisomerase IV subunit B
MDKNKKIISLTDFEHVLMRPTMWVGSVEVSQEAIPIISDKKLIQSSKKISVGFYKLMNEILDNAFDEAKRMKGKMKGVTIHFDSFTSRVSVTDTGNGFYKGTEINEKTGINNIETAMTGLRAGTNFFNKDSTDALIGTNGVGASLVNMLSTEFSIETTNEEMYFKKVWKNFEGVETIERKATKKDKLGTTISFIPRDKATVHEEEVKLFGGCVWDKDYIHTQMVFRNFLKKNDEFISNLEFEAYFDGQKLDLEIPFLPEQNITIKTKIGIFVFWRRFENATSVSFMNGAQCVGIHQKIFQDWINEMFDDNYAHHFYETLVLLNLPPKVVRFADQNKTKYAGGRWEIESLIKKAFWNKLHYDIPKSAIFKDIKKAIQERMFNDAMNSIKRQKKQKKQKVSEKYVPPTTTKDTLFIVEGNSARGSILQRRNSESDGVYTLKGKIKNARSISDLSKNTEIIDIMTILGIDPKNFDKCTYNKIVIATDWDPDGIGHIASLLINLFYRWFPTTIDQGKLFILITPLVSAEVSGKPVYFYSLKEFKDFEAKENKCKNVRYLKGLGSLDVADWDWVMAQRRMFKIYNDKSSKRFIDIAFGASSQKRKNWLQSTEA